MMRPPRRREAALARTVTLAAALIVSPSTGLAEAPAPPEPPRAASSAALGARWTRPGFTSTDDKGARAPVGLTTPVRIVFDALLLTGGEDGVRAITPRERDRLVVEARSCMERARAYLSRAEARRYFRRVYKLDSLSLLDHPGLVLQLRTFSVRWDLPASERAVQVGGYLFGETTISLNVQLLMATTRQPGTSAWRDYAAGVIVHELAHLADFLDDGHNNDGGIGSQGEEGEEAQKACGCYHRLPAPLMPMAWMLHAWSQGPRIAGPVRPFQGEP